MRVTRFILGALGMMSGVAAAGELHGYQAFSLDEAQAKARADGRPVLLYLTDSSWRAISLSRSPRPFECSTLSLSSNTVAAGWRVWV